jgi:hypothetical protein
MLKAKKNSSARAGLPAKKKIIKTPISTGSINILTTKHQCALRIARTHTKLEDTISAVGYITSDSEDNPQEPIKLLEINSAVTPSGFFPVTFGPSETTPFKRTLVELTPKEAKDLDNGKLEGWPSGWKIEKWLYKKRKMTVSRRKKK